VVSIEDAARMAMELPGVEEGERHGNRSWSVAGRTFAWERAFSKADVKRFGDTPPPDGPIVAVRLEDLHEKEAVLAAGHRGFFTIPHFDGYAAVLVHLDRISRRRLAEVVAEAWAAKAPSALVREHLERFPD
jgi:hypothetical protein